jgi:hypothetical protein
MRDRGMVSTMTGIGNIPADVRWMIATRAANDLPFAYTATFRQVVGEMYEKELAGALRTVWEAAGAEQAVYAQAFGLPVNSARAVAETFSTLSVLFLGPEMDNGIVTGGPGKSAVVTLDSCPMCSRAEKFGMDRRAVSGDCAAYCTGAVGSLNPGFSVRFTKRLCAGDGNCEIRVESRT